MKQTSLGIVLSGVLITAGACGGRAERPVAGTGGANGSGGQDNSGGSVVEDGSGGQGDLGGQDGSGGSVPAKMTTEEWQALIAPHYAPYEIWDVACDGAPIAQDYAIIPSLQCTWDNADTGQRWGKCFVNTCNSSLDCTESPRGRCEGKPVQVCVYPDAAVPCTANEDCRAHDEGSCIYLQGGEDFALCYPDGTCEQAPRRCYYQPSNCESDNDCDPGGKCERQIHYAVCHYDTCSEDKDCPSGQVCDCSTCNEPTCATDQECASNQHCAPSKRCGEPLGYYCTTPQDECSPEEDECLYQDHRFVTSGRCD